MRFRFYIAAQHEGWVQGTNDEEKAKAFAESWDYIVIDSENGKALMPGAELSEIKEVGA